MVLEQCRWCMHWDWKWETCGLSCTCLNRVSNGESPTWYRDIRPIMEAEALRMKESQNVNKT